MINIYLSHKISGGDEKTPVENMKANCKEARRIGKIIQDALPMVNVYVPGGPTEQFVRRAWQKDMLTVPQIMEIDCDIVADSDMLLCYAPLEDGAITGGRVEEVNHAISHGVPNYVFHNVDYAIQFADTFFKLGALV
jgi:hypothetical protein